MEFKPKHTIFDSEKFQKSREKLGGFILEGMETTGGTDVDWLIEHKGGFIVLENKEFVNDSISIKMGQMIAFEQLYKKLLPKCHFLFCGYDNIDFKNPESIIYYFDMKDWEAIRLTTEFNEKFKTYYVERKSMDPLTLKEFRDLIEQYWKEFENSQNSSKRF